MPKKRVNCKRCNAHVVAVGRLSKRGFCEACSEALIREGIARQLTPVGRELGRKYRQLRGVR